LAQLTWLYFGFNQISSPGIAALSEALAKGALASLKMLYVDGNALGTEHPALKATCEAREIVLLY